MPDWRECAATCWHGGGRLKLGDDVGGFRLVAIEKRNGDAYVMLRFRKDAFGTYCWLGIGVLRPPRRDDIAIRIADEWAFMLDNLPPAVEAARAAELMARSSATPTLSAGCSRRSDSGCAGTKATKPEIRLDLSTEV